MARRPNLKGRGFGLAGDLKNLMTKLALVSNKYKAKI